MKSEQELQELFSAELPALQELFAAKKEEAFRKARTGGLVTAVLCAAAGTAVFLFLPDAVPPLFLLFGGVGFTVIVWAAVFSPSSANAESSSRSG